MLGMRIAQAKGLFFDRAVVDATRRAERRVLSKFGAFVRTAARSSLRKRRGASKAGAPPSSHTGLLKKFIFFAFDPQRRSVIVGPARLDGGPGTAPATLEYGGTARIPDRKRGAREVRIAPRPYMQPAAEAEKQKLPALWKNSITKTG